MDETRQPYHNHYVYYSYEEWGRGYIGSRTAPKGLSPQEDIEYMGSYKRDGTFNPTAKIILETYETREEANQAEIVLHNFYEVARNPHFANRAKATSTRFSIAGMKHSEEALQKMSKARRGKRYYNNGEKDLLCSQDEIPVGCVAGKLPYKEETLKSIHKKRIGKKIYNNGIVQKFFREDEVPASWGLGPLPLSTAAADKISEATSGKKWYNNGTNHKRLGPNDEIPEGYILGKLPHSEESKKKIGLYIKSKAEREHLKSIMSNKKWYNNGEKQIRINQEEIPPEGFIKGRLKSKRSNDNQS